jgi:hypothetical protein
MPTVTGPPVRIMEDTTKQSTNPRGEGQIRKPAKQRPRIYQTIHRGRRKRGTELKEVD